MQPQVVHEAEVHRQHVRLKIPISVEIDGTRFTVDDWSLGGFGILSEISSRQPGERFPARLIFPFEDFDVSLRVDCHMVYILDDNTRFGCRFLGMSAGQLSLFRYLVDAYLSGEMVSGGDILHIAGRENTAEARRDLGIVVPDEDESMGRKIRRGLGYAALGVAGLFLAGLIWVGIDDRFLTVRAQSAVIETPMVRMKAPIAGMLRPLETRDLLQPGDAIARIEGADGASAVIESPCTCVVADWMVVAGQFVQQGEPAVVLVSAEEPLLVQSRVDFEKAMRLEVGDVAEIRIPGREAPVLGQVERIDFKPSLARQFDEAADARRLARVTVRPDRPFDFDELGSLVSVTFR